MSSGTSASGMGSLLWYVHRLRAMSPSELTAHGRRKIHQLSDRALAGRRFAAVRDLPEGQTFPLLPPREAAPPGFQAALQRDVADILRGRWIAFGHLPLEVDVPPRWHKDYLAGVDLKTSKPALKLHHRLEGKADIKLIWEPNRWYSLVRLAQGAYLLGDTQAAAACLRCLEDWVEKNPPYFGWNWTSGLESGLRLIQFVWIDALHGAANVESAGTASHLQSETRRESSAGLSARWARVRAGVLLPHLWFTWRDRSFGSSANNHLLGELAGLILALVRWPGLARWAAPLDRIQSLWEREVLTQFATDGGNREQALNYHLFGFEFCWQARLALRAAARTVSPRVDDRLRAAAAFFAAVQVLDQQWDYGDSDSAYVTPFFAEWPRASSEWSQWLEKPASSPSIRYWIGDPPKPLHPRTVSTVAKHWRIYPESGFAVCRYGEWFLRWDLSPLGYLSTAGHGHCDALHLSIWYQGQPIVIDPGTGVYHADRPVRDYLASWDAHNGPHPGHATFPERRGAFLWSAHHEKPSWQELSELSISAELRLPTGTMRRTITRLEPHNGWQIEDSFCPAAPNRVQETVVFWQLAPSARLQRTDNQSFRIAVGKTAIAIELDAKWQKVEYSSSALAQEVTAEPTPQFRGVCSCAFRRVEKAPFILLRGTARSSAGLKTILCAGEARGFS